MSYIKDRWCMSCGKPKPMLGGAIKFVLGTRSWVCKGCKFLLDESRKEKSNGRKQK